MRVLVTGSNGQLGQDLVNLLKNYPMETYAYTKSELDIINQEAVHAIVHKIRPDVIINAAAYTKVDLAESNEDIAFAVNAWGQRNLSVAAEMYGAKMCYISTDYVFDGSGKEPYKEYDQINPLGVYGKSKYAGEELTKTLSTKYFIVRTAWVYGEHGNNFVHTMLRLAKDQNKLGVVNDQVGSPTYTVDLAQFIVRLIQTEKYGIYHATNSGSCTWYDFSKAIFEESSLEVKVTPLTTEEFPNKATRPSYSVLDNFAMRVNGFGQLRPWREALSEFINNK
ncbi:dTDP-4-dehydrorhamnose reductase [Cytobacillus sp.]|uniref:dTDP-4-dehydrorhamnose reductase n=1 Tax=Cytobacillus sp. TaxID=2675269 RepID=UPI0028BEF4E7|nr:dTDP-4-dehydrorhamnose reductase [Cytobacillus sp.]